MPSDGESKVDDSAASSRKIFLTGMTCEACGKLIAKTVEKSGAKVGSVDVKEGSVTIIADEKAFAAAKKGLADRGFRERMNGESPESGRGDIKRVKDYLLSILAGEEHVEAEALLAKYALAAAAIIIGAGILGSGILIDAFRSAGTAISLLALVAFTSVMAAFSYYHMGSFRRYMSCMHGMMVGMTAGMMIGFMVGAIVGATNGMFIGSVAGVAVGIFFGFTLGRFCGVMGAMEGIMAGLMSGTMGAMTSVMMLNDHMMVFLYILLGICGLTVGALSYMMYREAGPAPDVAYSKGFGRFLMLSIYISAAMLIIMMFGPRGAITFIR